MITLQVNSGTVPALWEQEERSSPSGAQAGIVTMIPGEVTECNCINKNCCIEDEIKSY